MVAEHAQHSRRGRVLAFLLARGDDEPGGDVAQAPFLPAQVQRHGEHGIVGDGGAADGLDRKRRLRRRRRSRTALLCHPLVVACDQRQQQVHTVSPPSLVMEGGNTGAVKRRYVLETGRAR